MLYCGRDIFITQPPTPMLNRILTLTATSIAILATWGPEGDITWGPEGDITWGPEGDITWAPVEVLATFVTGLF